MVGISNKPLVENVKASLLDTLGACPSCGYNLRGITMARCSECGRRLEFALAVRTRTLPWSVVGFLVCLGLLLGLAAFPLVVVLAVWVGADVLLPLWPFLGVLLPCLLVFSVGIRMVRRFEEARMRGRLLWLASLLAFVLYEAVNVVSFIGSNVMVMS